MKMLPFAVVIFLSGCSSLDVVPCRSAAGDKAYCFQVTYGIERRDR